MKKAVALVLVLCLCLHLTGCWNYRELESIVIVTGAAADIEPDGKWLLTAEIVDYSMGGAKSSGQPNYVAAKGDTVFEAIRSMISLASAKLYWGHTSVLVISRKVAENGIVDFIDFFARKNEVRVSSYLVVSGEKTAQEVLKLGSVNNAFRAYGIVSILSDMNFVSKAPVQRMSDVIEQLPEAGLAQVLPVVRAVSINNKKMLSINGCAYFTKGKLAGFLNGEDTMTMLFVTDDVKGGVLNIEVANEPPAKSSVGHVGLEIQKSKTKVVPVFDGNKFTFAVDIQTETTAADLQTRKKIISEKGIEDFTRTAEKQLQERILSFVQTMQQSGPDLLKFGLAVKRELPAVWKNVSKNWPDYFADADVIVKSTIKVLHFGEAKDQLEVGAP